VRAIETIYAPLIGEILTVYISVKIGDKYYYAENEKKKTVKYE